jgi:hypothetical protein
MYRKNAKTRAERSGRTAVGQAARIEYDEDVMLWIVIIVALCPLISYGAEWLFRRQPASSTAGKRSVRARG